MNIRMGSLILHNLHDILEFDLKCYFLVFIDETFKSTIKYYKFTKYIDSVEMHIENDLHALCKFLNFIEITVLSLFLIRWL